MMNRRAVGWSEAAGCAFIYNCAVFLHFIYPLSGGAALGILFGAVNESVWEHTKIFSIAYVGWAVLQLFWLKVHIRQYVVAKCIGLYAMMGLITGSYYGYTALTGRNILWVDILSSLTAVILAQAISYWLETSDRRLEAYFPPALILLTVYYLMFLSFTACPPKLGLFRDPISGGFGVPENRSA